MRRAVEEDGAQLGLERLDARAERRLRDVARLGGDPKVPVAFERDGVAKLEERHVDKRM